MDSRNPPFASRMPYIPRQTYPAMLYQQQYEYLPDGKGEDNVFADDSNGLGLYAEARPLPFSGVSSQNTLALTTPAAAISWPSAALSSSGTANWPNSYNPTWSHAPYTEPLALDTLNPITSYDGRLFSDRSSIASSNEPSIFSRAGSEVHYSNIKLEDNIEWPSTRTSTPAKHNVALGNLPRASGALDVDESSSLQPVRSYEPAGKKKTSSIGKRRSSRTLSSSAIESSRAMVKSAQPSIKGPGARTRRRRMTTTEDNYKYKCEICNKMMQTMYNYKQHLQTHDINREKPNICGYGGCTMAFVRRTDMLRHQQSVHFKNRDYQCGLCFSTFARKDTLQRHEDDGCSQRPRTGRARSNARLSQDQPQQPPTPATDSFHFDAPASMASLSSTITAPLFNLERYPSQSHRR